MTKPTLIPSLASAIAAGTASTFDMEQAGVDAVIAAKSAAVPHYRAVSKASKAKDGRTRSYVFSDERVDRQGDIIRQRGWDTDNFKSASGPILWGHNSYAPPIGTGGKLSVKSIDGMRSLIGDVTLADDEVNPEAGLIWRMVEAGIVTTGSVGFAPVELRWGEDIPQKEREKLGLGPWGVVYEKQELLEFSLVSLPANPGSREIERGLKGMISKGDISDADAARFLKVYPCDADAALERAKASVRSVVDMGRLLVADEQRDAEATPEPVPPTDLDNEGGNHAPTTPDEADGGTPSTDGPDTPPDAPEDAEVPSGLERAMDAMTALAEATTKAVDQITEGMAAMRQLSDQLTDLAERSATTPNGPTAPEGQADPDAGDEDAEQAKALADLGAALERATRSLSSSPK